MKNHDKTPLHYLVGHGFKEYGCSWYFFLFSHEAVCKVTSVWEVQAHDPSMGLHKGRVDSKVSRWTLIWFREQGSQTVWEPRDDEKLTRLKAQQMSESALWYLNTAARWRPIFLSPDQKPLAPFSDRVSPAGQHTPYRHSTWMPGLDFWSIKVKKKMNFKTSQNITSQWKSSCTSDQGIPQSICCSYRNPGPPKQLC